MSRRRKTIDLVPHGSSVNNVLRELLTSEEVCSILKIKDHFLRDLRHQKRIPFVKIGHLVRYVPSQIQKWIESGASAHTSSEDVLEAIENVGG